MSEGPEGAAQLAIDWKILEDGRLQITLSSSLQPKRLADEVNPTGIRLLYVSDLCAILRKSAKSIAYESFLHHYCARHLSEIEHGLTLYQKGRLSGLEVSVSGRFIDILAVDSGGALVVIELKRSRGHQEVMTQLLVDSQAPRQAFAAGSRPHHCASDHRRFTPCRQCSPR